MTLILNILWILLGGAWMAVGWLIAALIMALSIIGLPWARAAVTMAGFALLPFGFQAMNREAAFGLPDIGTGPLGTLGNLIWLIVAGWWLALGHLISAVLLALTIIGLPFAWAHLKLASFALWPVGRTIVPR
ncbi:MAG: YccF domain-containing protein [Pararhodobacter sp.]|nr:YccF domain-containing protein [Pararhodobacter sp.]